MDIRRVFYLRGSLLRQVAQRGGCVRERTRGVRRRRLPGPAGGASAVGRAGERPFPFRMVVAVVGRRGGRLGAGCGWWGRWWWLWPGARFWFAVSGRPPETAPKAGR